MHTVLVLGGYGYFGTIISRLLARHSDLRVLIGGRNLQRAHQCAEALGKSTVSGVQIDYTSSNFVHELLQLKVDTVIHTAGPFQGQNYSVAQHCIKARCHYIDIADSRAFVSGIYQLDKYALAKNVLVASGASSVPSLAAAVVDHFLPEFSRLDEIRHGISAGSKTPGLATIQGVLGYCGQPFRRYENGNWRIVHGWQGLHKRHFPSPIGKQWMGNCDVPDLELFPHRYPSVHTVTFHAGLEIATSHLATWGLSWLARGRLVGNAARFGRRLKTLSEKMEQRGQGNSAMHIELNGLDQAGRPYNRAWHLVARNGHGIHIPCAVASLLARKLALGEISKRGATPCLDLFALYEYLHELRDLDIAQHVE